MLAVIIANGNEERKEMWAGVGGIMITRRGGRRHQGQLTGSSGGNSGGGEKSLTLFSTRGCGVWQNTLQGAHNPRTFIDPYPYIKLFLTQPTHYILPVTQVPPHGKNTFLGHFGYR